MPNKWNVDQSSNIIYFLNRWQNLFLNKNLSLKFLKSTLLVSPGRKIVDPAIRETESIKYTPDATIEYRLRT